MTDRVGQSVPRRQLAGPWFWRLRMRLMDWMLATGNRVDPGHRYESRTDEDHIYIWREPAAREGR